MRKPDFVRRHEAGIVTDGSVSALRSALVRLLANDGFARRMGDAGRRAARQELSLDGFGERLETSYRRLLEGAASPDYGAPFASIFQRAGGDFYKIDPMLFSPAVAVVTAVESGETFFGGEINESALNASFS